MKKSIRKSLALILAALMLLSILAGCSKANTETPNAGDSKTEQPAANGDAQQPAENTASDSEEVVVTLWANQYNPSELGPQYDPIMDKIAEETGVRISAADYENGSNEKEQLATMMAANDLPDIFYVPDIESLNTLIEAGQIMDLTPYWNEENCPNLCGANAVASGRQNFFADTKMDGAHYTVLMWGGTGAEDQPTVGFYVPWEVYAQAGYPEVSSLDDLVKALAAMHELHGENAEGQQVYGTGAWFADEGPWGSWCIDQIQLAMGYGVDPNFVYCFDMATNDLTDASPITDPDSIWWQAVKFYYDLNQLGLLDPDSITQKSDQWTEKAYSGRYLMTMPGWETANLKQNTGMSYVALKPMGDSITLDWSGELTGNMYAVSSTCKNPEKALQLLDYLWTPEGSRLAHSGIEGVGWEMVDGKAQYTQQRIADQTALSDADFVAKYGSSLGHFMGYALNVISPVDNSTFELSYTPEYRASTFTDAEKDAFVHYGVDSLRGIYTKDMKNVKLTLAEYTGNMQPMPDDLQKNATDLQNFVLRNYLSCVFAKDDAEFEAQKQNIIDGAADYNIDGLFQWNKEEFARAKALVDPYLP